MERRNCWLKTTCVITTPVTVTSSKTASNSKTNSFTTLVSWRNACRAATPPSPRITPPSRRSGSPIQTTNFASIRRLARTTPASGSRCPTRRSTLAIKHRTTPPFARHAPNCWCLTTTSVIRRFTPISASTGSRNVSSRRNCRLCTGTMRRWTIRWMARVARQCQSFVAFSVTRVAIAPCGCVLWVWKPFYCLCVFVDVFWFVCVEYDEIWRLCLCW